MRRYWCERYNTGDGYFDGIGYVHGSGVKHSEGYERSFSPAMLVTGVKLEEVVLNAVLV